VWKLPKGLDDGDLSQLSASGAASSSNAGRTHSSLSGAGASRLVRQPVSDVDRHLTAHDTHPKHVIMQYDQAAVIITVMPWMASCKSMGSCFIMLLCMRMCLFVRDRPRCNGQCWTMKKVTAGSNRSSGSMTIHKLLPLMLAAQPTATQVV